MLNVVRQEETPMMTMQLPFNVGNEICVEMLNGTELRGRLLEDNEYYIMIDEKYVFGETVQVFKNEIKWVYRCISVTY